MDNTVEILVGARDTTKVDLDKLNLALDRLKARRDEIKVGVQDKEAKIELARLNVAIDRISAKVASPKIDVKGAARADLSILGVSLALDKLNEKSREAGRSGLAKMASGLGSMGMSAMSALAP